MLQFRSCIPSVANLIYVGGLKLTPAMPQGPTDMCLEGRVLGIIYKFRYINNEALKFCSYLLRLILSIKPAFETSCVTS